MTTFTVAEIVSAWEADEVWRTVLGWPNYAVSSHGRVRGPRTILSPAITRGYCVVTLMRDGVAKNRKVHSLVMEAFVGPPPFSGAMVAHNDGDQTNNRVSNLRWASAKENQADRTRHGTHIRGSEVRGAKLTERDIPTIRARISAGELYASIAQDFAVSVSTISLIKRNVIWGHVACDHAERGSML